MGAREKVRLDYDLEEANIADDAITNAIDEFHPNTIYRWAEFNDSPLRTKKVLAMLRWVRFNDNPLRTKKEVLAVLRKARASLID